MSRSRRRSRADKLRAMAEHPRSNPHEAAVARKALEAELAEAQHPGPSPAVPGDDIRWRVSPVDPDLTEWQLPGVYRQPPEPVKPAELAGADVQTSAREAYSVRFRRKKADGYWETKEETYYAPTKGAFETVEESWRRDYRDEEVELIGVKCQ